jgi:hypothetical protein
MVQAIFFAKLQKKKLTNLHMDYPPTGHKKPPTINQHPYSLVPQHKLTRALSVTSLLVFWKQRLSVPIS